MHDESLAATSRADLPSAKRGSCDA